MFELRNGEDIVRARAAARELGRTAGLGVMDQTRLATAVSELGRNAVRHAGAGRCELQDLSDELQVRVQARILDQGPGIADVDAALADRGSTDDDLVAGLPGTRRLVDVFEIASTPAGTVVTVQILRARRR